MADTFQSARCTRLRLAHRKHEMKKKNEKDRKRKILCFANLRVFLIDPAFSRADTKT
jgi:hypothetical protein